MSGARFRYALEPLRLTRQWDVAALMADLAEHNDVVARGEAALAALQLRLDDASAQWQACASAAVLQVAQLSRVGAYMGELNVQLRQQQDTLGADSAARDALVDRLMAAQRALDAVDQHRDGAHAEFVQLGASGDCKVADDQWNTLQTRAAQHDSEL